MDANWTGTITGTASANSGSSLSSTAVAIEDTTTNNWWNGTSFSAFGETFVGASGTTSWSLGLAAKNLTSANSYAVIAEATNALGKIGTSPTVNFTYDTAPPTVTITYPVNNTTYGFNWAGKITGTASSNSGTGTTITAVAVAIENTKTGKWWNGTAFNLGAQTFVPATGTAAWSLALAAQKLNWGVTYKVVAQATDSAGNIGTSSAVAFSYKTKKPKVTKVYPRYMGDCGGQCSTGIYWTITGTNFVPGATVSFPSTGPSADFSVVSGSVNVLNSTTIVLRVKDTGATKGKATVVVTNPGEAPAFGSIIATGKPDPASLSIIGPNDCRPGGAHHLAPEGVRHELLNVGQFRGLLLQPWDHRWQSYVLGRDRLGADHRLVERPHGQQQRHGAGREQGLRRLDQRPHRRGDTPWLVPDSSCPRYLT